MGGLDERVVVITGGARGQGAAEAGMCVDEGATIVITDILDVAGRALADEIGATYLHHDVVDSAEWLAVVDHTLAAFERFDGLVNNAGILIPGS